MVVKLPKNVHVCCADDLQIARVKAGLGTRRSDVETEASDVERVKSRKRRQKSFDVLDTDDEVERSVNTEVRAKTKSKLAWPVMPTTTACLS